MQLDYIGFLEKKRKNIGIVTKRKRKCKNKRGGGKEK